jgi:hypothetical protein
MKSNFYYITTNCQNCFHGFEAISEAVFNYNYTIYVPNF